MGRTAPEASVVWVMRAVDGAALDVEVVGGETTTTLVVVEVEEGVLVEVGEVVEGEGVIVAVELRTPEVVVSICLLFYLVR